MKKVLVLTFFTFNLAAIYAQKLPRFGAEIGMKTVLTKDIRIPYSDVVNYYGFISSNEKPDEIKEGKKFYYIYLWIPVAAPEIGVRMISPIPSDLKPAEDDFVSKVYNIYKDDKTTYFDTWITLERAQGVISFDDIASKHASANWARIEYNDDTRELYAQPSGSYYNSLFRVVSSVDNPLRSLTVGLYRIGFTTFKTGEVEGGFIAQVGSPIKLPGILMASDIKSLIEMKL